MPDGEDRIQVIARAVRTAYGEDAIAVVLRQIEAADGKTRADWAAILDCLRR